MYLTLSFQRATKEGKQATLPGTDIVSTFNILDSLSPDGLLYGSNRLFRGAKRVYDQLGVILVPESTFLQSQG